MATVPRPADYVTIGVTGDTRTEINLFAARLAAEVYAGRRVSMSDLILSALAVAAGHRDELISRLGTRGYEPADNLPNPHPEDTP